MNAPTTAPASSAAASPLPLYASRVKGRIASRRSINTNSGRLHLTVVKLPAPDEYTSPGTVELRSRAVLGEVGQEVDCRVRLGGYPRSYKVTDPETGEQRPVSTAENHLTVIE